MTQDYTSTAVTDKAISRARHLLGKADKLYKEGNYCDCLFKIEESIESVDDEPLS
jgi:HEPN domain-containing protein